MADELLTPAPPAVRPTPWRRLAGLPVAVRIGILYILARLVTTLFFVAAAQLAPNWSRFGRDASVGSFAAGWDAWWYWYVAGYGYPTTLPVNDAGLVSENAWAFMPLYAYAALGVGALFGSWVAGAVVVSLVAGYLSCLVLYRMLRMRGDDAMATWAVLFFACAPVAALFQIGYAESLFLLWLFLALWCVMRRRYAWLYLLIPLMGYTRPGVLAFALFLGLHGISRWITRRREPLPARHIAHIVLLGLLATAVGFSWQVIASIATGDPSAYLSTEMAWRRNWILDAPAHFVPLEGFVQAAGFWAGQWGTSQALVLALVALAVGGFAALLLFDPHVKRLGADLRLWSASYAVYLLAVFFPQSSIFRLLVPISPLWGAAAMPRSNTWRVGVLAACLVGQWWWIHTVYALAGTAIWTVP
ncbi:hypothetical protein G5T42_13070 [Microbacterium sp. 4R-513]|uniref:hypothetical protein n=1 Tax=Microbacterium sp. 4R-513 TaxID=2567934 RepID=UPI0013E0EAD7|nr:hypothetical protein [Microbacterium sp. 4R-513]QIG40293.1 hypothetical protein G5T42_13070 [Microbacterium sp. 4R-513]